MSCSLDIKEALAAPSAYPVQAVQYTGINVLATVQYHTGLYRIFVSLQKCIDCKSLTPSLITDGYYVAI